MKNKLIRIGLILQIPNAIILFIFLAFMSFKGIDIISKSINATEIFWILVISVFIIVNIFSIILIISGILSNKEEVEEY